MLRQLIYLGMICITLVMHIGCRSEQQILPIEPIKKVTPPIDPKIISPSQPKQITKTLPAKKTPPVPVKTTPIVNKLPKTDNRNVSQVKLPKPNDSRFLVANNFVTRWMVYGPFTFKNSLKTPHTGSVIHHAFVSDEKKLNEPNDTGQFLQPNKLCMKQFPGRVNLAKIYPGIEHATAYAVAYLDSDLVITNLKLYSGCGGYIKIWLNGQLIHTYNRHNRDSRWDQDIVNGIKLKKGRNLVVVKIVTIDKPWSFYFRLTDRNGLPLTFSQLPNN